MTLEDPIETRWSNGPTYSCIGQYQEQEIFAVVHLSILENIVTNAVQ